MIGFNMNARGSQGFKFRRGAWTEGSLFMAKLAVAAIPRSPESKGSSQIIGGIEKGFGKLKDKMINEIGGLGLNLHLAVTGDFNFMYQFESCKPSNQTLNELLRVIYNQKEKMGDQVMLQFCQCLMSFRKHVIMDDTGDLKLKIDIDL